VSTAVNGPRRPTGGRSSERGEHLLGRAHALARAALHEALEVLRGVLAGEVDVALGHALVAPEGRALPTRQYEYEQFSSGSKSGVDSVALPFRVLEIPGKTFSRLVRSAFA
jgi:hypothetical protein